MQKFFGSRDCVGVPTLPSRKQTGHSQAETGLNALKDEKKRSIRGICGLDKLLYLAEL